MRAENERAGTFLHERKRIRVVGKHFLIDPFRGAMAGNKRRKTRDDDLPHRLQAGEKMQILFRKASVAVQHAAGDGVLFLPALFSVFPVIQPVVFLVSADEKAGVPVGKPVQKPHHPFGMGEFPGVVTEKQIIADALLFRISKAALQRRIIPVDVRHHGDGQGKNAAAIRICCREKNSFVPHKCSFHS